MISVDTVYQTVLALANKEQRGYITPQEFNLHADHAQMDIFEQYFYDLNQFKRLPGNDTGYADMVNLIEDKISIFKKGPTDISDGVLLSTLPGGSDDVFYRVLNAWEKSHGKVVEEISCEDVYKTQHSPLTKATRNRPIYYKQDGKIYFRPTVEEYGFTPSKFEVNWIRRPRKPKWTYIVVNAKPLYNSTAADKQDFELHPSDQTDLIINILQLAGITIKDFNLAQAAAMEENRSIQQEKQ